MVYYCLQSTFTRIISFDPHNTLLRQRQGGCCGLLIKQKVKLRLREAKWFAYSPKVFKIIEPGPLSAQGPSQTIPAAPTGLVSGWSAPAARVLGPVLTHMPPVGRGCGAGQSGLLRAAQHHSWNVALHGRQPPSRMVSLSLAVLWGEKAWTKIRFRFLLEEEFLSQTTNSSRLGTPGFRDNLLRSELSGTFTAFGDFR